MGLIKAIAGSVGGVLADQWKEFFYCDSMPREILMTKGQKRTSSRSSNTKGEDNIISNGSVIAVNEGQCMMIVEQGKVVEFCAEPGEFKWDSSTEPSIFAGSFGTSLLNTFKEVGKRFTFGGDTGKDQRVYYFNTKEIMNNKFGTPTPIPFRVVDSRIGIDRDVDLRLNGTYVFRITDPMRFYVNVCANVRDSYNISSIESQLKAEFIDALMPAVGELSNLELRPNQIMMHTKELRDNMNKQLSADWVERRGLSIVSISLGGVTLSEQDAELLRQDQRAATYRDPNAAAGLTAVAAANAMQDAAKNTGGAAVGFMGMNMAAGMGGAQAANLFAVGAQQQQMQQQMQLQQQQMQMQQAQMQQQAPAAPAGDTWKCACGNTVSGKFCPECGAKKPEPKPADGWKCACGNFVTGKFCPECGAKKPEEAAGWTCSCGAVNKGKFCAECGAKKPTGAPLYRCDKCGWEPKDPKNPPRFCPECGDPFDDKDIQ